MFLVLTPSVAKLSEHRAHPLEAFEDLADRLRLLVAHGLAHLGQHIGYRERKRSAAI